ncbi:hypothetical protein FN846DRAFT_896281 [Sphaerosporella brunnea]|uniref:Uncharacterized protein n=1 Tax=Sphaerosporella brunnea TaxID=1250544 RepID=A0A5J5EDK9_9PEZI|nr:hypothetical protein FN846DRAFT_896281 [Sphaerosporella brunnea]
MTTLLTYYSIKPLRSVTMSQPIANESTPEAESWTIMPDGDWLQRNTDMLANSLSPAGEQLPRRLTQLAVRCVEQRSGRKLHQYERECLDEYILKHLPAAPAAGITDLGALSRNGTLFSQVDLIMDEIAGNVSTGSLTAPAQTIFVLDTPAALHAFLLQTVGEDPDSGMDTSSGTGGFSEGYEGTIVTSVETEKRVTSVHEEMAEADGEEESLATARNVRKRARGQGKQAPQILLCGYCRETFNKKSELIRHFTELQKPCTEKINFHPNVAGRQCDRCGCKTPGSPQALDSHEQHQRDFDDRVWIHNLGSRWIRIIPKFSGQTEVGPHERDASRTQRPQCFVFGKRNLEREQWQYRHVSFQLPPNGFKGSDVQARNS